MARAADGRAEPIGVADALARRPVEARDQFRNVARMEHIDAREHDSGGVHRRAVKRDMPGRAMSAPFSFQATVPKVRFVAWLSEVLKASVPFVEEIVPDNAPESDTPSAGL